MKHLILLTLLLTTAFAHAASTSAYTDLTKCKTLTSSEDDPNAPIDYFTSVCQGRDGFDVRLDGGDSRSWISLATHGTDNLVAENISFSFLQGQFPNIMGSLLEWRYTDGKLTALIIRTTGQDPYSIDRELLTLTVIRVDKNKLDKTCVVGVVDANKPNGNLKARAIADNKSAKCL